MSIRKQYLKTKPVCKVTFRVSKETADNAESIGIAGNFNEWKPEAAPMTRHKNGSFSLTLDLEATREYQFRYVMDDHIWKNDEEADRYEYSGIGHSENSIIVT